MKKKIDKHYAPPGCIAVASDANNPCFRCAFNNNENASLDMCLSQLCMSGVRPDGQSVIFKRILPLHILIGKIVAVLKGEL
jgi:hypothetical protein